MKHVGLITNLAGGYNKIATNDVVSGTRLANEHKETFNLYINNPQEVIKRHTTNTPINSIVDPYKLANEAREYRIL